MSGTIRKVQIAAGAIALVFALVLGLDGHLGIQSASALTIGTVNGGWTPENFASSCEAAGGQLIEVNYGGKNYSKCEFPSGNVNTCDWVKKICTFGIVSGPFNARIETVNGTLTTSGAGGSEPTPASANHTSSGAILTRDK
jgi:hypothetical protein